jgi:hypothetical protein
VQIKTVGQPECSFHPDLFPPFPSPSGRKSVSQTYRPLREAQILHAPALSHESLILLQAAAHDAGGDGEVAVVAVGVAKKLAFWSSSLSTDGSPESPFVPPRIVKLIERRLKKAIDSRKAGGFPRERHFGGLAGR